MNKKTSSYVSIKEIIRDNIKTYEKIIPNSQSEANINEDDFTKNLKSIEERLTIKIERKNSFTYQYNTDLNMNKYDIDFAELKNFNNFVPFVDLLSHHIPTNKDNSNVNFIPFQPEMIGMKYSDDNQQGKLKEESQFGSLKLKVFENFNKFHVDRRRISTLGKIKRYQYKKSNTNIHEKNRSLLNEFNSDYYLEQSYLDKQNEDRVQILKNNKAVKSIKSNINYEDELNNINNEENPSHFLNNYSNLLNYESIFRLNEYDDMRADDVNYNPINTVSINEEEKGEEKEKERQKWKEKENLTYEKKREDSLLEHKKYFIGFNKHIYQLIKKNNTYSNNVNNSQLDYSSTELVKFGIEVIGNVLKKKGGSTDDYHNRIGILSGPKFIWYKNLDNISINKYKGIIDVRTSMIHISSKGKVIKAGKANEIISFNQFFDMNEKLINKQITFKSSKFLNLIEQIVKYYLTLFEVIKSNTDIVTLRYISDSFTKIISSNSIESSKWICENIIWYGKLKSLSLSSLNEQDLATLLSNLSSSYINLHYLSIGIDNESYGRIDIKDYLYLFRLYFESDNSNSLNEIYLTDFRIESIKDFLSILSIQMRRKISMSTHHFNENLQSNSLISEKYIPFPFKSLGFKQSHKSEVEYKELSYINSSDIHFFLMEIVKIKNEDFSFSTSLQILDLEGTIVNDPEEFKKILYDFPYITEINITKTLINSNFILSNNTPTSVKNLNFFSKGSTKSKKRLVNFENNNVYQVKDYLINYEGLFNSDQTRVFSTLERIYCLNTSVNERTLLGILNLYDNFLLFKEIHLSSYFDLIDLKYKSDNPTLNLKLNSKMIDFSIVVNHVKRKDDGYCENSLEIEFYE